MWKGKVVHGWCSVMIVAGMLCSAGTIRKEKREVDIWKDDEGENQVEGLAVNLSNDDSVIDINRMPRVLNFFPVPFVEECRARDGRRRGICMNTYECRIQGGNSHGFCALGFGVCCIFTATCNQQVINNLTYFANPDYPDFTTGMSTCQLSVKKVSQDVSQIRLDFIHFNLGQPNRNTGECEQDIFYMTAPTSTRELKICGMNSGQHVYFDVENLEYDIEINMTLGRKAVTRFWEVLITQIPFTERAPVGCLQYHQGPTGIVQTMNFADNGRHLADQDYNICIRQELDMCSIVYEPCHENAFRIAPNTEDEEENVEEDSEADTNIDEGSGTDDTEETVRALDLCNDKIVLPCDSEDLVMPEMLGMTPSTCSLTHCGSTLCPSGNSPCRIESSITPFTIEVHFGHSVKETSPEENLGMCLTYEQMPCVT